MKISNTLKNLIVVCVSVVVGLALCEIGLRVVGISYPVFETYDELRGITLRPNKVGIYRGEGSGAYTRINSLGYRDVEHSIKKPPHTFRIAILGDSFTEARHVAFEDNFGSYIARDLKTCSALGDNTVEVMNFGTSRYGTTQELLTLQHHVWQFSPDMVLLAVFTGNDIANNSRELMSSSAGMDSFGPFHLFEDGKLVIDDSFSKFSFSLLLKRILIEGVHNLRLLEVVNQARRVRQIKRSKASGNEKFSIGLFDEIYSPPTTVDWKNAWAVTEELFSIFNNESREHGAIFMLATLSNDVQVELDPERKAKFMKRLGVNDLFYPDRRIQSIGNKYGFPVITMAQRLQETAEQEGVYMHGFKNTAMGKGHWNEEGHRFAGEIIVNDICTELLRSQG